MGSSGVLPATVENYINNGLGTIDVESAEWDQEFAFVISPVGRTWIQENAADIKNKNNVYKNEFYSNYRVNDAEFNYGKVCGCTSNVGLATTYARGKLMEEYGVSEWIIGEALGYARNHNLSTTDLSLDQSIPLANDSSSEGCPALVLLVNSSFIDTSKTPYKTAADALISGDYYLVVEPITWLYEATSNGVYNSNGNMTYGSYYNIASQWRGSDNGGFYASYLTKLGNNCMIVDSNFTTSNGKTITASSIVQRNVSVSVSEMNSKIGLSMHLYSGTDINGTSTYDEALGDTPGLAPDDSSQLTETSRAKTTGHANIVKFYEGSTNGTVTEKYSFTRTPTPNSIAIENEQTWIVKDWYTSTTFKEASGSTPTYSTYKSSMSNIQKGTSTGTVTLSTDNTLYVLLVKSTGGGGNPPPETGDWTLSQSRLTRHVSTVTDSGTDILSSVKFIVEFSSLSDNHRHNYTRQDPVYDPDTHEIIGYDWVPDWDDYDMPITDNTITVSLKQNSNINSLVCAARFTGTDTATRNNKHEATQDFVAGYKYEIVIHRANKDKATLYTGATTPTGSSASSTGVNNLGIGFSLGTKSTSARSNGSTTSSLSMNFSADTSASELITQSTCEDNDGEISTDTAKIATTHDTSGSVVINTYAGQPSTGLSAKTNTSAVLTLGVTNNNRASGRMLSGKSFTFTPYIQMQYDTLDSSNITQYVTGQYTRTFYGNDYAEVAWNYTGAGNLHVTSNQWSTHASALDLSKDYFGNNTTNSVLPGGATYSLDTNKSNQLVQVSTYQTVLMNNGLAQASATATVSSDLTVSSAQIAHNNFVNSVTSGLEALNLEQYVEKDHDKSDAFDGIKVYNGSSISSLSNGSSNASSDTKYYLKQDTNSSLSNIDDADLDVKNKGTDTTYYTFYSTTDGNIHMAILNDAGNSIKSDTIILNKYQDASALTNTIAININNRTCVVDNLVAALERNTGNDTSASWASSDGHWYNEAFNGVTIMKQTTTLEVGLLLPSVRSTVLDPKLTPKQSSKSNMFTEYYLCQYRTSDTSSIYTTANIIGKFKNVDITMRDLNQLFESQVFLIPNATVQDLSK